MGAARPDVGVIVVAAGRSTRMGAAIPKVWLELGGRPVLEWSLRTLARFPALAELVLVVREEEQARAQELLARCEPEFAARARIAAGGAERHDSVRNGLAALTSGEVAVVLVHDAARPLASVELFERVADAARRQRAVVPALAVVDTIRRRDGTAKLATVSREGLFAIQTPQGFERRLLERAYAGGAPKETTDDGMLVEALGERVALVDGEPGNLKITTPADLAHAARLLDRAAAPARIGLGHDLHRLVPGGPLRLGGIDVESEAHSEGHSDGDVLLHALADAVLGALALGDLGQHFSDRNPANRGRDSADFLRHAVALARERGHEPAQVDVVVKLERPRLAPHRERLVESVARLLGLPRDAVSIKAKTGEGLDAIGEGRAIACDALIQMRRADR
jgi:2-C-methyl-D-erythritol 4-phosphate cytidylyltransferase/2-C-methyl-D-erythritol 2,4-cyclodiphosphate synthase